MNTSTGALVVSILGSKSYKEIYSKMKDFTANRSSVTPDELWLLEHPPIYTLGQGAKGDIIEVMNINSRKKVMAVITGSDKVTVK